MLRVIVAGSATDCVSRKTTFACVYQAAPQTAAYFLWANLAVSNPAPLTHRGSTLSTGSLEACARLL